MKNWNNLEHGDKVKNIKTGDVLEVYIWGNKKYLATDDCMWFVSKFDCREWDKCHIDRHVNKM